MKVNEFTYYLPKGSIAQEPHHPRDRCRLLILHKDGKIEHRIFYHIVDYLQKKDALVINTTKVIPARLTGKKRRTGGKAEVFLLEKILDNRWQCILKPFRKIKEDDKIVFPGSELTAKIIQKKEKSSALVDFASAGSLEDNLFKAGKIPLPPYIKRKKGPTCKDENEYQTVYARNSGAVAAPTAGLHFTPELLREIKEKGVEIIELILHTGWASFFSLGEEDVEKNHLPAEYFKISPSAAKKINECKKRGGRVIAVGTTTVRALETNSSQSALSSGEGWTELFIYPEYKFKIVDALITNFHIPRSSLLLLVSAFVGREKLILAYKEALDKGYRFLSYGDAMLII
ncbi:tRNA preQ1(34) S-adenosylmethionine ribosyltransferase-isomerase QueA [Candidatus Aerophobetes bacterium]|nr:tRNA preQ1(34) S-adenosylmethionine ribosyltransferase-isomerase QueA [Candidatus Aerophobetes bacterium]